MDSRREPYSVQESVERLVVNPVFRAAPWDEERLKEHEQDPRVHVLLVSESDVCRSVLAAALLRQELQAAGLEGAVRIDTCGTRPYNVGEGPEPAAEAAAATLGLTLPADHAARLFEPAEDIVRHDLLLVMDKFTAGDVMREVSSFDLVNRDQQFSYKVRRLGEFRAGKALPGAIAAAGAQQPSGGHGQAQATAHVGGSGLTGAGLAGFGGGDGSDESLDVEDPLYGNWGGEEEQRAVLQAAEDMREACRGLVALLAELRDQLQAELQEGGHGEGQEAEEEGAAASSVGLYGQEDVACELPLPGEKPVCSGDDMGVEGDWGAEEGGKGPGQGGALLPLGPRLRARVQGMGVAPWLVPPMLSPRTTVG